MKIFSIAILSLTVLASCGESRYDCKSIDEAYSQSGVVKCGPGYMHPNPEPTYNEAR